MKTFKWTTLFGFVVVLLIGFTIYDFRQAKLDEEKKELETRVVTLMKEKIDRIDYSSHGSFAEQRELIRDGATWKIKKPFEDSADQQAVLTFIESLTSEKITDIIAENAADVEGGWATYGLEKPLFELTLAAGSEQQSLKIGSVKAFDGSLYARIGDEMRVVLLSSAWDVYLSKPARELRDKRVYRGNMKVAAEVLTIKGKIDTRLVDEEFRKDGAAEWTQTRGAKKDLVWDAKAIDAYVEEVKALRAFDYTSVKTSNTLGMNAIGLKSPAFIVEIRFAGQETPFRLAIAGPEKPGVSNLMATSSDLPLAVAIYHVAAKGVMKSARDFRLEKKSESQ